MDAVEQWAKGLDLEMLSDVDLWLKAAAIVGIVIVAANVWVLVGEYIRTQRSMREMHFANMAAQKQHFAFHEELRKKLVAIAKQQSNGAIDLLRQLEANDGAAHAH